MLNSDAVRTIFEESGGILTGHFRLSSGRHSAEYWEKFRVLTNPGAVSQLCGEIARRFASSPLDVVMGPTTGGILLAFEVARQLGIPALYAEKENGIRTLRRGQTLRPGTRILVVDDVMTAGGALVECLEVASARQADVVGCAVLVDRSGGTVRPHARVESLLQVHPETFAADACPLCREGIPISEPGTTFLQAR